LNVLSGGHAKEFFEKCVVYERVCDERVCDERVCDERVCVVYERVGG